MKTGHGVLIIYHYAARHPVEWSASAAKTHALGTWTAGSFGTDHTHLAVLFTYQVGRNGVTFWVPCLFQKGRRLSTEANILGQVHLIGKLRSWYYSLHGHRRHIGTLLIPKEDAVSSLLSSKTRPRYTWTKLLGGFRLLTMLEESLKAIEGPPARRRALKRSEWRAGVVFLDFNLAGELHIRATLEVLVLDALVCEDAQLFNIPFSRTPTDYEKIFNTIQIPVCECKSPQFIAVPGS